MTRETDRERASTPEDIPRLFVTFVQAGDFAGVASLYEDDAVLALPAGHITTGRDAIETVFAERFSGQMTLDPTTIEVLPVLHCGDLALTSMRLPDGRITAEVARQQADTSWRWVIDQPNANG